MQPPALMELAGYPDWPSYENALVDVFHRDLASGFLFRGMKVQCRRHPEIYGHWAGFWHLISEGEVEHERLPDLDRCARLPWVRWVIEQADSHPEIDCWQNLRRREVSEVLWYRETYLVVLSQRRGYWLLKTAYCTDHHGRAQKLRRERDDFLAGRTRY